LRQTSFYVIIFSMKQTPNLFLILFVAFIPMIVMAKVKCPDYPGPKHKKFIDAATDYNLEPPYGGGMFSNGRTKYFSSPFKAIIAPKCTVDAVNNALRKISACIWYSKAKDRHVSISFPPRESIDQIHDLKTQLEKSGCFSFELDFRLPEPARN